MCFDTEKTQAPRDISDREIRDMRDKARAELLRGVPLDRLADNMAAGMVARSLSDSEIIDQLFRYHPPTPDQIPRYGAINQAAKNFAEVILANCPRGGDRTYAIELLRDARMRANSAIALDGLTL